MYHYHIHLCFLDCPEPIRKWIQEMPPPEQFTYSYSVCAGVEDPLLAQADLILARLPQEGGETFLSSLAQGRKADARVILLLEREQISQVLSGPLQPDDMWMLPPLEEEIRFRFSRWQGVGGVMYGRSCELALAERSRTLEALFSTLDCGVIYHSVDGSRLISINKAALRLLDYESEEELVASGFHFVAQSILDEDKPMLRERINSLVRPGDSTGVEYRVRHKDGTMLHILGNVKLLEKNGERYYQRFLLDFTDRKRQEDERERDLHYQERLFQVFANLLADNVDDVYIMLNSDGSRVEFVSNNVERVLGIPQEEVFANANRIGRAEYMTGHAITNQDLAAMKPGTSLPYMETERVHRKTGERKWFRESVFCVSIQGQIKIVAYLSDRTQERSTQNALSEALDIAQVANKAKSTFLSNVSHDIRTPMNAIMGCVALLKEDAEDPERVLEYTQKISAASQHLLGLINDVLDMTKIESGNVVLNITDLNLAELVEELNAIIRPQTVAKEQNFEISTSSLTAEHLFGDKLRITQVLINILSNAVKYTPVRGRISMKVEELPQIVPDFAHIRFTIQDNGMGMSEDYLKIIFDPFTRDRGATENRIQGTGLGMAITKSIVDMMHGTIKVESRKGEGSTFSVELELQIQDREDDPKFWEKHGIRHILVTDDDEDICRDILHKMSKTGVDTEYATDGAKALHMIINAKNSGNPFDLVLLDWKMPELDGLATARLIRRNTPGNTPILLFSAYDWSEIRKEAEEVGIKFYMPKPFFLSNFKTTIQHMQVGGEKPAQKSAKSVVEGKHIMVVDDIDVNRMILVKILSTLGATCDTAENGEKAAAKFSRSQPGEFDLILMDVQMPIMNGYEATRAIRESEHPDARLVPIIAMTANAFVDDVRDALDAGMDGHIPKPIVVEQMANTIQEILEKKSRAGAV